MIARTALAAAAIFCALSSTVRAEVSAERPREAGYVALEVQGVKHPYNVVLNFRNRSGEQTREIFRFSENVRTIFIHGAQLRNMANLADEQDKFESVCISIASDKYRDLYSWGGNPYYGCIDPRNRALNRAIQDAVAGRRGRPVAFPAPKVAD